MTDAILDVVDLHKVFPAPRGLRRQPDLVALNGVSFTMPTGGALGVVGESGSGKTTVARILVGLEEPTSGKYMIDGVDPRSLGRSKTARMARARRVQMVFQDPYSSFDPRQSVTETIDRILGLHFNHTPAERSKRIRNLLDQVGLDERRGNSMPRSLSGGERQRAAIARALAVQSRLLILDEAVAALDVSIQAQILNLLVQLRRQAEISYLFLSHDLAVVRQVTDHVIVMQNGNIVEHGPTETILQRPQHPYTKLLLSCIPREGWTPRNTKPDRDAAMHESASPTPAAHGAEDGGLI